MGRRPSRWLEIAIPCNRSTMNYDEPHRDAVVRGERKKTTTCVLYRVHEVGKLTPLPRHLRAIAYPSTLQNTTMGRDAEVSWVRHQRRAERAIVQCVGRHGFMAHGLILVVSQYTQPCAMAKDDSRRPRPSHTTRPGSPREAPGGDCARLV